MADFVLSIADADVDRVTAALCGSFNLSYVHEAVDPNVNPVGPDTAKAVLIDLLRTITVQVETIAAQAAIVPPTMS